MREDGLSSTHGVLDRTMARSKAAFRLSLIIAAGGASLAGCSTPTPSARAVATTNPIGKIWMAQDIGGAAVVGQDPITLTLREDGRADGSTGCNRYSGKYLLRDGRLTVSEVQTTQRGCAPDLMAQEQRFGSALERVASWRIDDGGNLMLATNDGISLRFVSAEAADSASRP